MSRSRRRDRRRAKSPAPGGPAVGVRLGGRCTGSRSQLKSFGSIWITAQPDSSSCRQQRRGLLMNVLIIGAAGRTGAIVVERAVADRHLVTAFVRDAATYRTPA